jgi:Ser/Thr protein kinase RdoA (MazF antagonist)
MTTPTFFFDQLTPDMMWTSLAELGIRAESGFLALNSYENRVYQFVDEEKQRYVVKFYRPQRWSEAQIIEEHQFSQELADQEIPIVAPLKINGHSLHQSHGYFFAVFPSAGGRQFEVDNWEQLEWVGRYLGRLHQVGKASRFQHRPTLSIEEFLTQPKALLENSSFIPTHIERAFFTTLDDLSSLIKEQYPSDISVLRLHGDCHPGNILWRDEPIFVDMDDARNGPAVQDIWMLLSGERNEKLAQLDTVLEAYQEFCDFNHSELKLIEPLRGLRMVHYMAWLAKRWQDPAFPAAFPWFGESRYWENQVLALREQIAALNEPALSLTPQW